MIIDHQIDLPSGDVGWNVVRLLEPDEPPQTKNLTAHLYDGRAGVALFLAALEIVQPGSGWCQRSLATVAPTRRAMRKVLAVEENRRSFRLGLGGIFGLGGLIYAYTRVADMLKDAELLQEARDLTVLVTEERLAAEVCDDLVSGVAGMVAALLVLHEVSQDPLPAGGTSLDLARMCGQRLVDKRVSYEDRPRGWVSVPKFPPLSGFSHGAAGVAYALMRLYRATGERAFLEAAREGIEFERTTYSPEDRNWLDLRALSKGQQRCLNNWCHGAPGIALSRLEILDIEDTSAIREELGIALETTRAQKLTMADHVCCGNMGRAEILFQAARTLQSDDLLEEAMRLALRVRNKASDSYDFHWQLPQGFDPGFFTGASGIGYAFLRLAEPSLPCILAMN